MELRVEWEESNKTPVDLHVSLYTTRELLPVCGQPDPPHLAAGLQTSPGRGARPPSSLSLSLDASGSIYGRDLLQPE